MKVVSYFEGIKITNVWKKKCLIKHLDLSAMKYVDISGERL
jgi:hypothetical protein